MTGFQQPSGSQEHRPLLCTGLSLRGFVQRSLPAPPREPGGMASSVAWACWGPGIAGCCPSSISVLLLVPPAHLFPLQCLPVGDTVALGGGFSRLRAPPSVSLGSTPGCCSLAIAWSRVKASTWCLGEYESDRDVGQHCQAKSMLCWGNLPRHSLRLYF